MELCKRPGSWSMYEPLGDIFVNLVSGKSRVTPLKKTTILRMELSGNLFLSRLINTVYNTSKIKFKQLDEYIGVTLW